MDVCFNVGDWECGHGKKRELTAVCGRMGPWCSAPRPSCAVGVTAGFYPENRRCVNFKEDDDGTVEVIPSDVDGLYESPDPNTRIEATKTWHLTRNDFLKGIGEARRLKMLISSGYKYNAVNNNCVHAVARVAAAAGIQLPLTEFGWYAYTSPEAFLLTPVRTNTTLRMCLGPTAYGLGIDLRNMK